MQVLDVDSVPTHVFKLKSLAPNTALLLVVPGSPGMGHFYIPFASRLFELGQGSFDIAVVSHAGHSPGYCRPMDGGGNDWYALEDQVAHKMAYLRDHASEKQTLYLVGHSIGCYIILHMLKHIAPDRVSKVFFLFPTLERMGETPNGRRLMPFFRQCLRPATALVWLVTWIPEAVRKAVLKYVYFRSTPWNHVDDMVQAAINIDSKSLHNILNMARQEMEQVTDPPLELIRDHVHKMSFYYGVDDHWTLPSCHRDMAERFSEHDVQLCTRGYPHAFVMEASAEMADYVHSRLAESRMKILLLLYTTEIQ